MKWKQRKANSRLHAQSRKKSRGRQSGATNKKTKHQETLVDIGFFNLLNLFSYIKLPNHKER